MRLMVFNSAAHKHAFIAAISAFGTLMGAGAGYKYAQVTLQRKYEDLANDEIRAAKAFYQKPSLPMQAEEDGTYMEETLQQVEIPSEAEEALAVYQGKPEGEGPTPYHKMHDPEKVGEEVVTVTQTTTTIFQQGGDLEEFDYETELLKRDQESPYIISSQEYDELTEEHVPVVLTFYEDDEVLVDSREDPVNDIDSVIGLDNIKFGYGSGDRNVVYIRNEPMDMVIELLRSPGSFAKEIGFGDTDELQHSHRGKVRRFRADDDG